MPTINVGPGSNQDLQAIANALGKSKKVVVVTGAGISTNCGIPDFRSEDGLYSLIQAQYDKSLQNPPWESTNTFDIDDRPKKRKRPSYFYEVVAADGNVVGVIDDEASTPQENQLEQESKSPILLPSSSPLSLRSTTPSFNHSDSDLLSRRPSLSAESSCNASAASQTDPSSPDPDCSSRNGSQPPEQNEDTIFVESDVKTTHSRRSTRSPILQPESASTLATTSRLPSHFDSYQDSKPNEENTIVCSSSIFKVPPLNRRGTLQREDTSFRSTKSDDEPAPTQSSQSSSRPSLPNLKGRDLFDSMIWSDPFTTSIFYMFISSLRQKIQNDVTGTTEAHNFIKVLRDGGRLVRNYTQNIDCLEQRLGLCTNLSRGPGHRSRFSPKTQREARPTDIDEQSPHNGGVEVVLLHGSLVDLRCGICAKLSSWNEADRESTTLAGQAPDCPSCTEYNAHRTRRGRRGLAVGRLRPDIVLYGEEHPHANLVGALVTHDLALGPDVLLIMGTSLKVHGLKFMLKEFAKAVHSRGGTVVFVNRSKPPESTWGDVIDYWIEWDCDAWVLDLKRRRADIWLPQGTTEERRRDPLDTKNRLSVEASRPIRNRAPRPQAARDDKMNGVFVTFKILDTLRLFPDAQGQIASRKPYWDKITPRRSTDSVKFVGRPSKKLMAPRWETKSLPAKSVVPVSTTGRQSQATKTEQGKRNDERERQVIEVWENLRRKAPGLGAAPPSNTLSILSRSFPSNPPNPFLFNAKSNYLPNIGGKYNWDIKGMPNLITHPPSGSVLPPLNSPKQELPKLVDPPKRPESKITNRTYATRSSRRLEVTDTTVDSTVIGSENSISDESTAVMESREVQDKAPTPPTSGHSSDPITPDFQRIKRIGSIGAILSSPEDEAEEWHDAAEEIS